MSEDYLYIWFYVNDEMQLTVIHEHEDLCLFNKRTMRTKHMQIGSVEVFPTVNPKMAPNKPCAGRMYPWNLEIADPNTASTVVG